MKNGCSFIVMMLLSLVGLNAQTPAFPGAEGWGRYATGGRGGKVVRVTNLADNASTEQVVDGSLRWALQQSSPKTIVFDVSGNIILKQSMRTGKDNVTIAGQTAPGDGICISGYGFTINSNNFIIRFVRFRPGDESKTELDGLGGMDKKNIIIDHCSVSWSVDECLSVYGCENLTVQWCIASEALRVSAHAKGTHCYGGNWGGNKASYHHNLIAHCESRVPRLGPRPSTQLNEYVDIRNNVFYNWAGNGCYGGEGMHVNLVNNYYKPGPATDKASSAVKYRIAKIGIRTTKYVTDATTGLPNTWKPMEHVWGKFYIAGNTIEGNAAVSKDNWTKGVYEQISNSECDNLYTAKTKDTIRLGAPLEMDVVTTHSANQAYAKVLDYVGCSLHRDEIDQRIVSDTRNRKATYTASGNKSGFINTPSDTKPIGAPADWSPWITLATTDAPVDTDEDGISDTWEDANGLDKRNGSDGNQKDAEGYTNLERYLNSLVETIVNNQNQDGVSGINNSQTDEDKVTACVINGSLVLGKLPIDSLINVYDMRGTLVYSDKVNVSETSFPLLSGLYIVWIASTERCAIKKIRMI